jgi:hypothetical protein
VRLAADILIVANSVFPVVDPFVVKPDQREKTTGAAADWFFLMVMLPVITTRPAAAPALEIVMFHHLGLDASKPAFAPLCPRFTFTSKALEKLGAMYNRATIR